MDGDRSFHSDYAKFCRTPKLKPMKRKVFIVISSGSFNGKVVQNALELGGRSDISQSNVLLICGLPFVIHYQAFIHIAPVIVWGA
jgi:hypothetical protein